MKLNAHASALAISHGRQFVRAILGQSAQLDRSNSSSSTGEEAPALTCRGLETATGRPLVKEMDKRWWGDREDGSQAQCCLFARLPGFQLWRRPAMAVLEPMEGTPGAHERHPCLPFFGVALAPQGTLHGADVSSASSASFARRPSYQKWNRYGTWFAGL